MLKKMVLLAVILTLSINIVYSNGFEASIVPVKDTISLGDSAEYKFRIINNEDIQQSFSIKTDDPTRWEVRTEPIMNPIIVDIATRSAAEILLFIKPNPGYFGERGSHSMNIEVASVTSGEKIILKPLIGLVGSDKTVMEYVPTVSLKTDIPDSIDPRKKVNFKVEIINENPLNITGAKITISSKLISKEIKVNLAPSQKYSIDLEASLDSKTAPSNDALDIKFEYQGKIIQQITKNFEISKYTDLVEAKTQKKSFLRRSETISYTNNGNTPYSGDLKVQITWSKRVFGSTQPEAKIATENGIQYYVWHAELAPLQTMTLVLKENYILPVIILLIIIIVLAYFYFTKSPISVKKEVSEIQTDEGGFANAKILLHIHNKASHDLESLEIYDKVPKLLHIEKHTTIGSLVPEKITHTKNHETIILWKIEALAPTEERVITYYIKSQLKILGGLTLQPTTVKYRIKGKEYKKKSNFAIIKG